MLKRPYANGPAAVPVSTPLGLLYVKPTSASHLYCTTDPDGPAQQQRGVFTVRGVPYRVSLHAFLNAAGEWTHVSDEREEDPDHQRAWKARERTMGNLRATRTDGGKGQGIMRDEASDAARKSLADAILPALNAWARTDEARALIRAAEVAHINNRLLATEEECEKKRAALAEEEAERMAHVNALRALGVDPYAYAGQCRWCSATVDGTDACAECEAERSERAARRAAAE